MRKFEFDKTYEEIEISGDVYRLNLDDESIKGYQIKLHEFYEKSQELGTVDAKTLEEQQDVFEKSKELTKDTLDTLLGEGSFDVLYPKSGESVMNLMDLAAELAEIISEQSEKRLDKKKAKYTKKKKK